MHPGRTATALFQPPAGAASLLRIAGIALLGLACLFGPTRPAAGQEGQTTFTTSTTHHDTHTTVDLPDAETYETRVVAVFKGLIVFDETLPYSDVSPEADAAITAARQALEDAGAGVIKGPTLTSSHDLDGPPLLVAQVFNHSETSVTATTTFGPATILIGEDQSETFFVEPGTTNINTNTHTENFYDDQYQATTQHVRVYTMFGKVESGPDSVQTTVPDPTPTTPPPDLSFDWNKTGARVGPAAAVFGPLENRPDLHTPQTLGVTSIRPPSTGNGGLR